MGQDFDPSQLPYGGLGVDLGDEGETIKARVPQGTGNRGMRANAPPDEEDDGDWQLPPDPDARFQPPPGGWFPGQGSNDPTVGDPWSTSAPWRPQAPTGGLYGALSDLAGGLLTPYEQGIGQRYENLANNPVNFLGGTGDTDVLGNYQWMASGQPNAQEAELWNNIRGRMGGPSENMNNVLGNWQWLASGLPNDAEAALINKYQQGALGGPTDYEQDVLGRYKDFASKDAFGYELDPLQRFQQLGNGPSALDDEVTRGYRGLQTPNQYTTGAGATGTNLANPNQTDLEKQAAGAYGGLTGTAQTPLEQGAATTAGDLAQLGKTEDEARVQQGWQQFGAGPNARENDVYGLLSKLATGGLNPEEAGLSAEFKKYGQAPGEAELAARRGNAELQTSQGYSPKEQSALSTEGMLAARQGFQNAGDAMARRRAATGQSAGYYGAAAQLGRDEASAMGQQARQNVLANAQEKARRQELGTAGMANLANVEQRRGEYGLTGQRDLAGQALQRQLGAIGQLQGANQAQRGYGAQALGGQQAGINEMIGRQEAGAGLQRGLAGDIASRIQAGAGGLGNLQQGITGRMGTGAGIQRGVGQDVLGGQQAGLGGMAGQSQADWARKQAAAGGLQNWANDFTRRQLEGTELADKWNQTQFGQRQQALGGLGSALDRLRGYQVTGTKGAQDWEQQLANQQGQATGQGADLLQALRGYQLAGTQGAQGWQNDMWQRLQQALAGQQGVAGQARQGQQFGLSGLQNLYNSSANDPLAALSIAAGILGKPQEVYTEGAGTGGNLSFGDAKGAGGTI